YSPSACGRRDGGPPDPQARRDPQPGTGCAPWPSRRRDQDPPHPSRPWAATSACRRPRRRTRGPHPTCAATPRTRTHDRTTDGTDESLEQHAPHRWDRAELTARDNALAESTIGLYKTELIRRRGPWRTIDDVELATLEWIDWFNHRRLH